MYKHILLPTDGSVLSQMAVSSGILLARDTGAAVTGIHVIPLQIMERNQLDAWMHHDADYAARRQALFEKFAAQYLSYIEHCASAEGVACTCKVVASDEPYRAILDTARDGQCDLIVMAAHGKQGDTALIMGSETFKVLLHGALAVLVHKSVAE